MHTVFELKEYEVVEILSIKVDEVMHIQNKKYQIVEMAKKKKVDEAVEMALIIIILFTMKYFIFT